MWWKITWYEIKLLIALFKIRMPRVEGDYIAMSAPEGYHGAQPLHTNLAPTPDMQLDSVNFNVVYLE